MSVENKIKELMEGKVEEALSQGNPDPAQSVAKDTTLRASVEGERNTRPRQGNSQDASYEGRDEDDENQGRKASGSTPDAPRPNNAGPGGTKDWKTVADPTSVINMPNSKGNVTREETEEADDDKQVVELNMEEVKEEMKALLGEDASPEFAEKAASLFEAAVIARANSEIEKLTESIDERVTAQLQEERDALVEQIDEYLGYVVENWMKENQLAVDMGLRTEIAENFIENMKQLFAESYIEVPDEKLDILEEVHKSNEELTEKLNNVMNDAIELANTVVELKKERIQESLSRDLAATQAEKLAKLLEGVEYESDELYREKVSAIKEKYFPKSTGSVTSGSDTLVEDVTSQPAFGSDDTVQQYAQVLSRTAPKKR